MTPTEAYDRIQELLAEVERLLPIAHGRGDAYLPASKLMAFTPEAESEGGDHD